MTDSETDMATLLVVDDSRLMRVAARKILKNDFNIVEAADGEEAWKTLQEHPDISLVMSDLSMPNLDGLGLLKRIRESDFSELPVIIVTGAEDDDGSKKTALAAGASDFITKPFESIQLLARAKSQARQKDTQEALQKSETEKQQLREVSPVDPLTGLASKHAFFSHLEENLAYATRHQTDISLLLVRIEKYKILYLRRGKQIAETLAREIATILSEGRRREDTVGRVALDTFGILLPSADQVGANHVLAQLQDAIDKTQISVEGEVVPFNIRFGLCKPDIRANICAEDVMSLAEAELTAQVMPVTAKAALRPETPKTLQQTESVEIPAKQEAATPDEIHQALNALANNTEPTATPDALARGILPVLSAWNRSHDQKYDHLVKAIHEALFAAENPQTATAPPPNPPELVD
ncbi:hypothetical protein MNBD_GAMMA15-1935 [hydrothermal vent metagenome]|uniref:Uncharacterized protein n=1 Tax=hydrothermal vent metagenome TaxID=652676 RepID=A0A3B0Y372_9ZZZZ